MLKTALTLFDWIPHKTEFADLLAVTKGTSVIYHPALPEYQRLSDVVSPRKNSAQHQMASHSVSYRPS